MTDHIRTKITAFNKYLEATATGEEEIITRLENLQVLLAQSGNLLAEAKYIRDGEVNEAITGVISDPEYVGMSVSTVNKYIDTKAKDANYLVNQLDRINSAAGKQIMALQTILSYRKEQMRL